MQYSNYCYVDTASGGPQNRNHIQDIRKLKYTGNTDCYRTYFRYPENFTEHFKKAKSVKGYSGYAFADWFPVDVDSADLEKALAVARDFVSRLEVNFDLDTGILPIFFSGAKGFHILLPAAVLRITPSPHIAQVFKAFAKDLLAPWNIEYDSSIYDISRLFRAANTINSKTGLYKIPLSVTELFSLDVSGIKNLAKSPRKVDFVPPEENEVLAALYRHAVEKVEAGPQVGNVKLNTAEQELPRNAKLCYHELLKGVAEGGRDNVAYRLATYFKRQGLPADMTEGVLQAWNRRNQPPLSADIIAAKVKSAYTGMASDFGCNDEILSKHCQPGCYLRKSRTAEDGITSIKTFDEVAADYQNYVKNLSTKQYKLDIPKIGPAMRGIAPGEVCMLIARAGVGKTSMLINLLARLGMGNKSPQLFFTMEQPPVQIFERMAQIANKLKGSDIEKTFGTGNQEDKLCIQETARRFFEQTLMVGRDFLSVDEMIRLVRLAESQKVNGKVGLVAIDYLGRCGGSKDLYTKLSQNALEVKHMAKELDCAVICLAQTNRKGEDGSVELSMDMIRESGQVEEAADFIIGMWRPKIKESADSPNDILTLKLLKNRKGAAGISYDMKFEKPYLRMDTWEGGYWPEDDGGPDFSYFGEVMP